MENYDSAFSQFWGLSVSFIKSLIKNSRRKKFFQPENSRDCRCKRKKGINLFHTMPISFFYKDI
jgi:hypothetical protein